MGVRAFSACELGNSSHLLLDPEVGQAIAIDPLPDVEDVLKVVEDQGLKLSWALETHVHHGIVSGARELVAAAGQRQLGHERIRVIEDGYSGWVALRVSLGR